MTKEGLREVLSGYHYSLSDRSEQHIRGIQCVLDILPAKTELSDIPLLEESKFWNSANFQNFLAEHRGKDGKEDDDVKEKLSELYSRLKEFAQNLIKKIHENNAENWAEYSEKQEKTRKKQKWFLIALLGGIALLALAATVFTGIRISKGDNAFPMVPELIGLFDFILGIFGLFYELHDDQKKKNEYAEQKQTSDDEVKKAESIQTQLNRIIKTEISVSRSYTQNGGTQTNNGNMSFGDGTKNIVINQK